MLGHRRASEVVPGMICVRGEILSWSGHGRMRGTLYEIYRHLTRIYLETKITMDKENRYHHPFHTLGCTIKQ